MITHVETLNMLFICIGTLTAAITFILQLLASQCLPNLGQQKMKQTREHVQISCFVIKDQYAACAAFFL